jgi:hypothetical protein
VLEGNAISRMPLFFIVRTQLGCGFKRCWMRAIC